MIPLKKNPNKDVNRLRGLFFNIGLVIALLLAIVVFEFKTYDKGSEVDVVAKNEHFEELVDIPQTIQPPPPKPVIHQPEIIEVPDEQEIEEEIEIDLDIEMTEDDVIEEVIVSIDEPEEEVVDEIFTIVEDQPKPYGGFAEFYNYVGKELKYPAQARRLGIEGRVFVQFVVEKDGTLTDIQVVKGIGGGCDEEAIRILEKYPHKWTAGKQRGNPVRVRFSWSLKFQLAK